MLGRLKDWAMVRCEDERRHVLCASHRRMQAHDALAVGRLLGCLDDRAVGQPASRLSYF